MPKILFGHMEEDSFKKSWIQTLHREKFNNSDNTGRRKGFGCGEEETSKTIALEAKKEMELY